MKTKEIVTTKEKMTAEEKREHTEELIEKVVDKIYALPYRDDNLALYEILAVIYNYQE